MVSNPTVKTDIINSIIEGIRKKEKSIFILYGNSLSHFFMMINDTGTAIPSGLLHWRGAQLRRTVSELPGKSHYIH